MIVYISENLIKIINLYIIFNYSPDLSGIFEQYSIISIICIACDVGNGLIANSFGKYYIYREIDIINNKES
jgi:hypothetical protein